MGCGCAIRERPVLIDCESLPYTQESIYLRKSDRVKGVNTVLPHLSSIKLKPSANKNTLATEVVNEQPELSNKKNPPATKAVDEQPERTVQSSMQEALKRRGLRYFSDDEEDY